MSKIDGLQLALQKSSGKPALPASPSLPQPAAGAQAIPAAKARPSSRQGKEYTGAWLKPDFGKGLRMVQLRRGRDEQGRKVYLDDLIAEALNDLFTKYDVPTVQHDY